MCDIGFMLDVNHCCIISFMLDVNNCESDKYACARLLYVLSCLFCHSLLHMH